MSIKDNIKKVRDNVYKAQRWNDSKNPYSLKTKPK